MSLPPPRTATLPALVWREIGRPTTGDAADWATWVALFDRYGGAFYRSLVVADGFIAVVVEFHPRRGSASRTIHRGQCGLPQDVGLTGECVRLLLIAADEAVAKALEADRGDQGAAPGYKPDKPRGEGRHCVSATWQELEQDLRERAYFLWEGEGCPEGRAQEFWERARQGEARAA